MLHEGRQWLVEHGNHRRRRGDIAAALCGADVVIGVSGPGARRCTTDMKLTAAT